MSTLPECVKCGNYIHGGFVVCDTCNDELPTIRAELTQLRTQLAALSWAQWIPVSERLPEVSLDVLVLDKDNIQYIAYARDGGTWINADAGFEISNYVTHWMQLPPAPDKQ